MKVILAIFLLGGIVLLVLSFFMNERTLDVHLYDTYYVINLTYVCWTSALLQFAFAFLYKFLRNKFASKAIAWIHAAVTIIFLYLVSLSPYFTHSHPKDYLTWKTFKTYQIQDNIATVLVIAFIFAQGLFVFNLVIGYVKNSPKIPGNR